MKKLLLFLLMLMLLSSCDAEPETTPSLLSGENVVTTQTLDGIRQNDVILRTQYPIYEKSCDYISVFIENNSAETIEFGTEWMVEKSVDGVWRKVEFMDNLGWTMPLLMVMPDGEYILNCSLDIFKDQLTDGEYRIVKELSATWYAAEFKIGDSPITAEAPHGFVPLDKLPHDYTPEAAAADGVVVCSPTGIQNGEKIGEFFRYAADRSFRGQMRIARFTNEGNMILTDVIRSHPDRIDCMTDTTRDAFGKNEITTEYYSYFTGTEDNIYLSNRMECDPITDRELFAPRCISAEVADTVAKYYTSPYGNFPAVSVWSPSGAVNAASNGGVELWINTSGWGSTFGLRSENRMDGMTITDLIWQNDHVFAVEATLPDDSYYYEFIRVDEANMNAIESVSYTYTSHRYTMDNGSISIPE